MKDDKKTKKNQKKLDALEAVNELIAQARKDSRIDTLQALRQQASDGTVIDAEVLDGMIDEIEATPVSEVK